MNVLKNLSFSIFSFLLLLSFFSNTAYAQSSPTASETTNTPSTHVLTQTIFMDLLSVLSCQLAGVDSIDTNRPCLTKNNNSSKSFSSANPSSFRPGGLLFFATNTIGVLYTPPLHASDYVRYLSNNFGFVKHAYAAPPGCSGGIGFCGLRPLINIWTIFRNISYLFFVVVFVLIGLAITLRLKIDPRTVMSIENQIPKIIIGLLLVTFSFAIAGFMIDMMYVGIGILFNAFGTYAGGLTVNDAQTSSVFGFAQQTVGFGNILWGSSGAVGWTIDSALGFWGNIMGGLLLGAFSYAFSHFAFGGWISTTIASFFNQIGWTIPIVGIDIQLSPKAIADIITGFVGFVLGGALGIGKIGSMIAFLIITIAVLWSLFRLLFMLLIAYIYILIDTVLAPFWITLGLIPGNSALTFESWLRDLAANLLTFPATIAFFLLGKVFVYEFATASPGVTPFVPPLLGVQYDLSALGALIGLGIILMAPQALTIMRDALKSPQLKYTAAIGQAVGAGAAAPNRIIGGAASTQLSPHYINTPTGPQLVYPGGNIGRLMRGFGLVR